MRKLCDEYGALLIFDEVITGFRLAFGGAAEYFGVTPDHIPFLRPENRCNDPGEVSEGAVSCRCDPGIR